MYVTTGPGVQKTIRASIGATTKAGVYPVVTYDPTTAATPPSAATSSSRLKRRDLDYVGASVTWPVASPKAPVPSVECRGVSFPVMWRPSIGYAKSIVQHVAESPSGWVKIPLKFRFESARSDGGKRGRISGLWARGQGSFRKPVVHFPSPWIVRVSLSFDPDPFDNALAVRSTSGL